MYNQPAIIMGSLACIFHHVQEVSGAEINVLFQNTGSDFGYFSKTSIETFQFPFPHTFKIKRILPLCTYCVICNPMPSHATADQNNLFKSWQAPRLCGEAGRLEWKSISCVLYKTCT